MACNSNTAYEILTQNLTDLFSTLKPGEDGYTYGHEPDLSISPTTLDERLDLILYSNGNLEPKRIKYFNDEERDRTPSGLWISDHVGVVGTFKISKDD